MNTEKIKELISNSDILNIQKNVLIGFIGRAEERENEILEIKKLIESTSYKQQVDEILLSTDEVKIFTIIPKNDWDRDALYRSIIKRPDGNWTSVAHVARSLDEALLIYLQYKYLGLNSQFTDFAERMLEMKFD